MLQREIENAQRRVRTDAYQMSIGEIVNMYKDGELVINPDFQRLFRWEIGQKAKLIESILLGIPLPSIFVFETDGGKWELIDGLQRISTILEFMGLLRGSEPPHAIRPPSALVATKYLPSLNNVVWERDERIEGVALQDQVELDKSHQIAVRRARMSVEILKRPSDNNTKYDLFQRLNAGGTEANSQELRNCIVIMVNRGFFAVLKELAVSPNFDGVISATDDQKERQRHLEWATRFLVHNYVEYDGKLDIEEYIDEGIVQLAGREFSAEMQNRFTETFDLLHRAFGANALKRFDGERHSGRVGLVAFECIAVGISKNIAAIKMLANPVEHIQTKIREFWEQPQLQRFQSQGIRGTTRIQQTIPFGAQWFQP